MWSIWGQAAASSALLRSVQEDSYAAAQFRLLNRQAVLEEDNRRTPPLPEEE